jgi:hypothetical protein
MWLLPLTWWAAETGPTYGAFTPGVKSMLNENLGGILGDTRC